MKPLPQLLNVLVEQFVHAFPYASTLLLGGFAGATAKMVLAPQFSWRVWLVDLVVGLLCAVFIGGAVAEYLELAPSGYAASGFICGATGEILLRALRHRVAREIAKRNGHDNHS